MIEVSTPEATPSSSTPATPAPEAPKANTLEAVKAARREAASQTPPAETKPTDQKPTEGVKAEIEMDDAALKAATQLSKEAREAKAKIKELEGKAAVATKLEEAKGLVATGKKLQAFEMIAADLGFDLNDLVAEQLSMPATEGEGADPKATELQKTIAELKAAESKRTEKEKAADAERAKAARDADVKAVTDFVGKDAAKYTFLSRNPAWVDAAYAEAEKAYPDLVKEKGSDLTPEERHRLIVASLDEAEARHADTAKLYGASVTSNDLTDTRRAATQKPSARPTTFDASMRGGTVTPVTKPKTKLTLDEAKKQRRQSAA